MAEKPIKCWANYSGMFVHHQPSSATVENILPSGAYNIVPTMGNVCLIQREILLDDIVDAPDSLAENVSREIQRFWASHQKFKDIGILQRRGYLFYGPHGCGKTTLLMQIVQRVVNDQSGIVFWVEDLNTVTAGISYVRAIEKSRPIVCIYEDIESFIENEEETVLAVLDGEKRANMVLNIATTNNLESIPARIKNRARRFDRVIEVVAPNQEMRLAYLTSKLGKSIVPEKIDFWAKNSDGLTFASLTEMVVLMHCFDMDFDKAYSNAQALQESTDCHKNTRILPLLN